MNPSTLVKKQGIREGVTMYRSGIDIEELRRLQGLLDPAQPVGPEDEIALPHWKG